MDIESVKQIESANDGQTIHLFYDEVVGVYLAFGLLYHHVGLAIHDIF